MPQTPTLLLPAPGGRLDSKSYGRRHPPRPTADVFICVRDDFFLGVLHSRAHELWALNTSSRHGVGNQPTYNNTTCFETFPFPLDSEPQEMERPPISGKCS